MEPMDSSDVGQANLQASAPPSTSGALRWRRRGVLTGLVGLATVTGLGVHRWLVRPESVGTPVRGWLAQVLSPGLTFEHWQVVAVHPVRHGAVPVILGTDDGRRFQVDILARDPHGPPGVANTRHLSLYVHNRGDGSTQTDEAEGLGAMRLAAILAEHEGDQPVPDLLTLSQRTERFPGGSFNVPLHEHADG